MAAIRGTLESAFRRLEGKLGIDREGRSVWVWLLPPGIGLATALLVPFMPGLPTAMGLFDRLTLAIFGLITMTVIASIYLISFDNDHNQQAPADDPPARGDGDDHQRPPAPSGRRSRVCSHRGGGVPDAVDEQAEHVAGDSVRRKVPAASGTPR